MNLNYPADADLIAWANKHNMPPTAVLRDIARLVEILNLRDQGFFDEKSVLAGSMALRAFGSPRFTIFDTDLSTESEQTPTTINKLLSYQDQDIEITPVQTAPTSDGGGVWRAKPVRFEPYFSEIVFADRENEFAVDVAQRGLVKPGSEQLIKVPYAGLFKIWPGGKAQSVHMMDLEEICAEKILGWCAQQRAKHYADIGFIAAAYHAKLDHGSLRQTTMDKLAIMKAAQPDTYAQFERLEDLIAELTPPVNLPDEQWANISYITQSFTRDQIQMFVRTRLLPMLTKSV